MARPKKWGSEAERLASYRARTDSPKRTDSEPIRTESEPIRTESPIRTETARTDSFVAYKPQSVPLALFEGCGRGTVRTHTDGRRYVMVARHDGPDVGERGVVAHADWLARLDQRCAHGLAGWSCHAC